MCFGVFVYFAKSQSTKMSQGYYNLFTGGKQISHNLTNIRFSILNLGPWSPASPIQRIPKMCFGIKHDFVKSQSTKNVVGYYNLFAGGKQISHNLTNIRFSILNLGPWSPASLIQRLQPIRFGVLFVLCDITKYKNNTGVL